MDKDGQLTNQIDELSDDQWRVSPGQKVNMCTCDCNDCQDVNYHDCDEICIDEDDIEITEDVVFSTGAKRENKEGKGRYDLIPPSAMRRLANIYEIGATRYGDRNWEKGLPLSSAFDSAMRHLWRWRENYCDEDNLAAALWNICALIHTTEKISEEELPSSLNDIGVEIW